MQTETLNGDSPSIEVILATLCYLMSRYATSPKIDIAMAVSHHFRLLHEHPECSSQILQDVGRRMSIQWESLSKKADIFQNSCQPVH